MISDPDFGGTPAPEEKGPQPSPYLPQAPPCEPSWARMARIAHSKVILSAEQQGVVNPQVELDDTAVHFAKEAMAYRNMVLEGMEDEAALKLSQLAFSCLTMGHVLDKETQNTFSKSLHETFES